MLLDHVCGGRYDLDHVIGISVLGANFTMSSRLTSTLTFSKMGLNTAKSLHIAASLGHTDIARSLIEHGASVDSVDDHLCTPLHFAACRGQLQLTELLIDFNANVNAVNDRLVSPCMVAAAAGFLQPIQALVQAGADLTLQDQNCLTALQIATISSYLDIISFLNTNTEGYALNAETLSGESVLIMMSRWAYHSHSSFFLNLAPNPSIYEPRKSNVLTAVAETNHPAHLKKVLRRLAKELVPRLLAHRALRWGTPLYAAATKPAEKVIDMLLDAGAELELEGGEHGTPLMGACAAGRLGVVKTLVRKGAKTSYTKDDRVFSALLAAKHHVKVIRWLLVGRFMEGPLLIENGGT